MSDSIKEGIKLAMKKKPAKLLEAVKERLAELHTVNYETSKALEANRVFEKAVDTYREINEDVGIRKTYLSTLTNHRQMMEMLLGNVLVKNAPPESYSIKEVGYKDAFDLDDADEDLEDIEAELTDSDFDMDDDGDFDEEDIEIMMSEDVATDIEDISAGKRKNISIKLDSGQTIDVNKADADILSRSFNKVRGKMREDMVKRISADARSFLSALHQARKDK